MESSDPLPYLIYLFEFIAPGFTEYIILAIVLILLFCSALISGSEIAFFSLKRKEIDEMRTNDRYGKVVQLIDAYKGPEKLLATILIANNFVNVGIIILSTRSLDGVFKYDDGDEVLSVLVNVVVVTFFLLLFGEVLPKVYATYHNRQLARFMSFPLQILKKIFAPLSALLLKFTPIIDKNIRKKCCIDSQEKKAARIRNGRIVDAWAV